MKKKETAFIVKLAVFAAVAFAVVMTVQLQLKYNEYKAQKEVLKAEVAELEDKRDELREKAQSDPDREYIIEVAKEKLNLRMPEEIIFYNDLFN